MNGGPGDRYLDGDYLAHNPTWHAEHGSTKARWIDTMLVRNGLVPRTVAEVGCGSGQLLAGLKARRPDATMTGFEISPQAFAICSAKQADGLDFRLEDLLELESQQRMPGDHTLTFVAGAGGQLARAFAQ